LQQNGSNSLPLGEKGKDPLQNYANMIYIDLNRVGHDLEGEIKISCVFLPRFDLTEKLDVFSRLRLEMLSDEPSLDKKEDAFKAMIPPVSSLSLRNQVCYI